MELMSPVNDHVYSVSGAKLGNFIRRLIISVEVQSFQSSADNYLCTVHLLAVVTSEPIPLLRVYPCNEKLAY